MENHRKQLTQHRPRTIYKTGKAIESKENKWKAGKTIESEESRRKQGKPQKTRKTMEAEELIQGVAALDSHQMSAHFNRGRAGIIYKSLMCYCVLCCLSCMRKSASDTVTNCTREGSSVNRLAPMSVCAQGGSPLSKVSKRGTDDWPKWLFVAAISAHALLPHNFYVEGRFAGIDFFDPLGPPRLCDYCCSYCVVPLFYYFLKSDYHYTTILDVSCRVCRSVFDTQTMRIYIYI
jgi:hypothetical protein